MTLKKPAMQTISSKRCSNSNHESSLVKKLAQRHQDTKFLFGFLTLCAFEALCENKIRIAEIGVIMMKSATIHGKVGPFYSAVIL